MVVGSIPTIYAKYQNNQITAVTETDLEGSYKTKDKEHKQNKGAVEILFSFSVLKGDIVIYKSTRPSLGSVNCIHWLHGQTYLTQSLQNAIEAPLQLAGVRKGQMWQEKVVGQ